jgi:hypothetical protein
MQVKIIAMQSVLRVGHVSQDAVLVWFFLHDGRAAGFPI